MADTSVAPTEELHRFIAGSDFSRVGAVFTDLDGTAVLEREGRIYLPPEVEAGLRRIHAHGRPVIANTLRFPLSVIDVFGGVRASASGPPMLPASSTCAPSIAVPRPCSARRRGPCESISWPRRCA